MEPTWSSSTKRSNPSKIIKVAGDNKIREVGGNKTRGNGDKTKGGEETKEETKEDGEETINGGEAKEDGGLVLLTKVEESNGAIMWMATNGPNNKEKEMNLILSVHNNNKP